MDQILAYVVEHSELIETSSRLLGIPIEDCICAAVKTAAARQKAGVLLKGSIDEQNPKE